MQAYPAEQACEEPTRQLGEQEYWVTQLNLSEILCVFFHARSITQKKLLVFFMLARSPELV